MEWLTVTNILLVCIMIMLWWLVQTIRVMIDKLDNRIMNGTNRSNDYLANIEKKINGIHIDTGKLSFIKILLEKINDNTLSKN